MKALPAAFSGTEFSGGGATVFSWFAYAGLTDIHSEVTERAAAETIMNVFSIIHSAWLGEHRHRVSVATERWTRLRPSSTTAFDFLWRPDDGLRGNAEPDGGLLMSPGCWGAVLPTLAQVTPTYGTRRGSDSGVITFTGVKAYRAQGDADLDKRLDDGVVDVYLDEFAVGPQGGTLAASCRRYNWD